MEIDIAYPEIRDHSSIFLESLENGCSLDNEDEILAKLIVEGMVKAQTNPGIYGGNALRRATVYETVVPLTLESIYDFLEELEIMG